MDAVPNNKALTRLDLLRYSSWERRKEDFICEPRGTVYVKGKGEMEVWLVLSEKEAV